MIYRKERDQALIERSKQLGRQLKERISAQQQRVLPKKGRPPVPERAP